MMLNPTHPDVAKVLHLLDPCDVCDGDGLCNCPYQCICHHMVYERKIREAPCPCEGTGKALHPDRVAGALKRWLWSNGYEYSEGRNLFSNYSKHPSLYMDGEISQQLRTPDDVAMAYCAVVVVKAGLGA